MTADTVPCPLCIGAAADPSIGTFVWEDDLWRLWTVVRGTVPGFSILTPKRHVPHITDLAGREAETLGGVLARTTSALREVTGATVATSTSSARASRTCTSISLPTDLATR